MNLTLHSLDHRNICAQWFRASKRESLNVGGAWRMGEPPVSPWAVNSPIANGPVLLLMMDVKGAFSNSSRYVGCLSLILLFWVPLRALALILLLSLNWPWRKKNQQCHLPKNSSANPEVSSSWVIVTKASKEIPTVLTRGWMEQWKELWKGKLLHFAALELVIKQSSTHRESQTDWWRPGADPLNEISPALNLDDLRKLCHMSLYFYSGSPSVCFHMNYAEHSANNMICE